jgi:hypothetical protein
MNEDVDEDLPEPEPPSPEKVARRALVLAVVSCRGILELDPARDQAAAFWARVAAWWGRQGLRAELEPGEAVLLDAAFGEAPRQAAVDASWTSEALAVLAWALGRAELPAHNRQVNAAAASAALGFLKDHTVLEAPSLRPSDELEGYASVSLAVHWRLRDFSLNPRALDFARFCETAWFGPLSLQGVRLVDGDLAIGEAPLSRASERDVGTATSIASERHRAANWLLDASLPLSETDTST